MKKHSLRFQHIRCWEFFHCAPESREKCLLAEVQERRCWVIDIACCKIDVDTPRPLSVKKVVCKTCAFYKTYKDLGLI